MPTGDSFVWIGPVAGNWNTAANWQDVTSNTNPASTPPGASDSAAVGSPIKQIQTITGPGSAATLTFTGDDTVLGPLNTGTFVLNAGTLAIGSGVTAGFGGTLAANLGTVTGDDSHLYVTNGGLLAISGNLIDTGPLGDISVGDGGTLQTAGLVASFVDVDSPSSVTIGNGATATAGAITVGNGATFALTGTTYVSTYIYGLFSPFHPNAITSQVSGNLIVDNGGTVTAVGVMQGSLGGITIDSGGVFSSGGSLYLNSVVDNGSLTASLMAFGTLSGNGVVNALNNGLILIGQTVASDQLDMLLRSSATLSTEADIPAGNIINLSGGGDVVELTSILTSFGAEINGFGPSDEILVSNNGPYTVNAPEGFPLDHVIFTPGENGNPNTLALFDGATEVNALNLGSNNYLNWLIAQGDSFTVGQIGSTVSEITIACFAAGTHIATPRGAIAVERLHEGDTVLTVAGGRQQVQWIGWRNVDCRRHPNKDRVWPIHIAAHAFGEGRPRRPLLLSPDHSVFVEDVLIPIKFLLNDSTITQIAVDTIHYYHIELPRHDVVLAEGLPAETYLETGGRTAFENAGQIMQLHPDFTPDEGRVAMVWRNFGYAPLLGEDGQLERVQAKLSLQAGLLREQAARPTRRRRAWPQ